MKTMVEKSRIVLTVDYDEAVLIRQALDHFRPGRVKRKDEEEWGDFIMRWNLKLALILDDLNAALNILGPRMRRKKKDEKENGEEVGL